MPVHGTSWLGSWPDQLQISLPLPASPAPGGMLLEVIAVCAQLKGSVCTAADGPSLLCVSLGSLPTLAHQAAEEELACLPVQAPCKLSRLVLILHWLCSV